jgi:hypothetical protein
MERLRHRAGAWAAAGVVMIDDILLSVSFPKILSGGIRAVRQNQRIIQCDVCDHPPTCNVHSRSVQAATSA